MPQGDTGTDCGAQSAVERLGYLLQVRISTGRVSRDQLACRPTPVQASEPAQPAGFSSTGRYHVLPTLPATWASPPGDLMRAPVTKVSRRAGCGNPARPVRRGDGEPRIASVTRRPTLPAIRFFAGLAGNRQLSLYCARSRLSSCFNSAVICADAGSPYKFFSSFGSSLRSNNSQ
jgi:hypothetical protein